MKRLFPIFFLSLTVNLVLAQNKAEAQKAAPIDLNRYVLVEGGTFKMGTDKPVEKHESPVHEVKVNSFYLGKTEVTFDEYDAYCKATGKDLAPSGDWGRGNAPVFMVSWFDAVAYCNWLSDKEKLSRYYKIDGTNVTALDTAKGYRLPTEAEWEYAARGGNKAKGSYFAGSNEINEVGWFIDNAGSKTHPVAAKKPNELGLFDMTGNVWEWVWDYYDENYYAHSPAVNPQGPNTGSYRVMRGGAWFNYGNYSQVTTRQNHAPGFRQNSVGFRVARTLR